MHLNNYLFFTTACEAALSFYEQCGLGKATLILRHGAGTSMRGKVMHARFAGPGIDFFASDNEDAEPMRGSAHMLTMDTCDQTRSIFELLAEGGTITTPLGLQSWGDFYGKITDRFGVQWMLNCPTR